MFREKAPFIVSLILAAIGWAVTHTVDRMTGTPTIAFHLDARSSGKLLMTLRNVTRDHVFRDLTLVFTVEPGAAIQDVRVAPVEPAFEGDDPVVIYGRTAQLTFPQIQPAWAFSIVVRHTGKDRPRFRFEMKDGAIRATDESLETFFLAHEVCILLILVGTWTLFLLGWIVYRWLRPPERDLSPVPE